MLVKAMLINMVEFRHFVKHKIMSAVTSRYQNLYASGQVFHLQILQYKVTSSNRQNTTAQITTSQRNIIFRQIITLADGTFTDAPRHLYTIMPMQLPYELNN
jgi:hypothetical protein